MRMGRFKTLIIVTDGVVCSSRQEAGEGQNNIMGGIGKFFIPSDAFLRQQIGISTAEPCGAVFIVNIDHDLIFSAFSDGIMQPGGPMLIADLHKTELDSF